MKCMAFVLAVFAMAGVKGRAALLRRFRADTSSQMMMADTSHAMMSDVHMSADSISAERGATLYKDKGCAACHNIAKAGEDPHRRPGGKQSGPDLGGVTERRDRGWLRRWLKDPDAMRVSDPIAIAMTAERRVSRCRTALTIRRLRR
jgi:hypothetical protein